MTNPPGETPEPRPSWSWEPQSAGTRPPEDQPAEPQPVEPVPAPANEPAEPELPASTPTPVDPPAPPPPPPPTAVFTPAPERYPMHFTVDYPGAMSRWKTAFRIFLILPAWLFAWLVSHLVNIALVIGWVTVFTRRKYPLWLFRGLSGAFEHSARVWSYGALLTDNFPSFDREHSPVRLEYDVPPSGLLSRWRVLFWKSFLLIPTFFVLGFLSLAVFVVTALAWFAIIITGNYPRGMFQFSVGVQRWYFRAMGYFASFNDRYPPYALSEDTGPASHASTVASGVGGWALGGGFTALVIAAIIAATTPITQDVNYARLAAGNGTLPLFIESTRFNDSGFIGISLDRAVDPGEGLVAILEPSDGERVVVFEWSVLNATSGPALIRALPARLKYTHNTDGKPETRTIRAEIVTVANHAVPSSIPSGAAARIFAVFLIPSAAEPLELHLKGGFAATGIKYRFD